MADLRQAAQMALEALEGVDGPITALLGSLLGEPEPDTAGAKVRAAIAALRAALAAVQEPIGYVSWHTNCPPQFSETMGGVYRDTATRIEAVYTHPAPAAQPLTDEQIERLRLDIRGLYSLRTGPVKAIARAIERAHGIGGTNA